VKPSSNLAYWIGSVQSDGSFKSYINKKTGKIKDVRISFGVSTKSLPMLKKVQKLSILLFNRKSGIWKERKRDLWDYHICVKSLLHLFDKLDIKFKDPPRPPKWCLDEPNFFGAYLAGLIDGDGCIWLTIDKKYKTLVCRAKITSRLEQKELAEAIKEKLNCSLRIIPVKSTSILNGRLICGRGFNLEFLFSSKNLKFLERFIMPHLTIKHKKKRLEKYISHRLAAVV